jgi:SAM-dependent methyltransferase
VKEFNKIYEENLWGDPESRSGMGSTVVGTEALRPEVEALLLKYNIKSILDLGCGDNNWMRLVNLNGIEYTGADVVENLIKSNKEKYPDSNFVTLDATSDPLPNVDLILCRDVLGHLSNENVHKVLNNIYSSGSKYFLSTTLTGWDFNKTSAKDGGWRCINLLIKPFSLRPISLINEDCQTQYPTHNDKCLVLFDIDKMFFDKTRSGDMPPKTNRA